MAPDYEPRRLGRIASTLLILSLLFGLIATLIGMAGAAVLTWQLVIG